MDDGRSHTSNVRTVVKAPDECTDREREDFARLVREGFPSADARLPGRVLRARALAFFHDSDGSPCAVAALKTPPSVYRDDVFRQANSGIDPGDYLIELGWVFVSPSSRGRGIGAQLCRLLMANAAGTPVFATTRPDNLPMQAILEALGFARRGTPYPRRDELLVLYLRP